MSADSKNASLRRKFNVTANLTFGFVVVTFLWTSFSYAIATNTSSPAGSMGPLRRKQLFSTQSKNRPGSGVQTPCGPPAGYLPISNSYGELTGSAWHAGSIPPQCAFE